MELGLTTQNFWTSHHRERSKDMTNTTDPKSAIGRTPEWREIFLEHFDALRNTTQVDNSLDEAYSDQRTTETQQSSRHLRTNASRETSPVFIVRSRESSPVFRVNQSRDPTPGVEPGVSRE